MPTWFMILLPCLIVAAIALVALRVPIAREVLAGLRSAVWLVICAVYMLWLTLNLALRLTVLAVLVLVVAGFVTEVLSSLSHLHLLNADLPVRFWHVALLLSVLLLGHGIREWRELRRRPVLLTNVRLLLREAAAIDFSTSA